jgi:hypothetical protein
VSGTSHQRGIVFIFVTMAGLIFMSLFSLVLPHPALMQPDSQAYLSWSLFRTPGYPMFLAVVQHFDPSYVALPYLQMGLFIVSAAAMLEACHRLKPSVFVWSLAGAAIFANVFLWRYMWMVLTESLFMSCVMIYVACIACALRRRPGGLLWLTLAGAMLGIAILIRPVAYALLASTLVWTGIWWRPRFKALSTFLAPALACVVLASAWNLAARGVFATQAFGGYSFVGDVSLLIRPQPASPYNNLLEPIATKLQPAASRLPQDLASWSRYFWLTSESSGFAAYGTTLPAITAFVTRNAAAKHETLTDDQTIQRVNDLAMRISIATIMHEPLGYMRLAAVNFAAMWLLPVITTPSEVKYVTDMFCSPALQALYCPGGKASTVFYAAPGIIVVLKNAFFAVLFILSLVAIFTALTSGNASALLALAGIIGLNIDAHHALVALVNAGLPRYAMALWPFLCVFSACLLIMALSWLGGKKVLNHAAP